MLRVVAAAAANAKSHRNFDDDQKQALSVPSSCGAEDTPFLALMALMPTLKQAKGSVETRKNTHVELPAPAN